MICRKCKKEIPEASAFCNLCGAKQTVERGHSKRGNGLGSAYKVGNTWCAQVVAGVKENGTFRYKRKYGFRTKKEALEFLPTLANVPTVTPRTLEYYHKSWVDSDLEKLSKSKQTAYKIAWNKIESIHRTNVRDLNIVMLRDLVSEVAPTFYPARDIKSLLSHLLKLAIADQQITVNMSEYITLPKQKESEQTPWTESEIASMWDAYDTGDKMAAYILLMTYTGMMPGELLSCEKSMIHLDDHQIVGAGLKTDVRKAIPIAIPDLLVPVIESIMTFTPDDYPKIVRRNRWDFYNDYHDFTKSAKIRDLPMYSCRHTTATALAVGSNVAPSVIQRVMRHSKFSTTQHYIHPDTSDTYDAVNTLKGRVTDRVTE